jgi:pyrroline-5-carboxylate reductase
MSALANRRIGLIGAGNMAAALARGLLASGVVSPDRVRASDVNENRLGELKRAHGIEVTADNRALASWADLLVLAVKPQVIDTALADLTGSVAANALVVSIAAGVPLAAIEARLPAQAHTVRAMPNTAAMALAGATAIAPGSHASAGDLAAAKALFEAVGRVVVVDEALLDAVTGLSGSGPAYVMMAIEALADGGVKMGLSREAALTLAAQTVYGSAKLQLETGEHPARLRDMVTSPGGTTIAGIHALEAGGLRTTLMNAVESATHRSKELGAEASARLRKSGSG